MANTTRWGTTKWQAKAMTTQVASIGAIFTSMYHIKQRNPWPNSSASGMMNYSWLFACQGEIEPFKDHLSTRGLVTLTECFYALLLDR